MPVIFTCRKQTHKTHNAYKLTARNGKLSQKIPLLFNYYID